jgi:hypothetical protein
VNAQAYTLARGFHGAERGLEIPWAALYPTHQKMVDMYRNLKWISTPVINPYMNNLQMATLVHCIFPKLRDVQLKGEEDFPVMLDVDYDPGWKVEIPPTGAVTAPVMTAACASAKHCAKDARLNLGLDMQARMTCSF